MSAGTAPWTGVRRVRGTDVGEDPDRIDVRSPPEVSLDHVPGAENHPVLSNDERSRVGPLYANSPFEARKLGATIVARNIAAMIESAFMDRPREWRPLVYCWRGGQRSRALVQVLHEIGWRAAQLEGGYRAYRRHVAAELACVPQRVCFAGVFGPPRSGQSPAPSPLPP